MAINPLGLIAASAAFLSIWVGHVSVRKVEAVATRLWIPMTISFLLGIAVEIIAGRVANRLVATVFGIVGINLLWSVLELGRQARRVRRGHAPANPANPRHAALLMEPGSKATPLNPLSPPQPGKIHEKAGPYSGRQQA